MIKPIFIFSLPRSGSTFLQKTLMACPKITSISEPWFLLPAVYSTKKEGLLSVYSHESAHTAFEDMVGNLAGDKSEYYEFLREFSLKLYARFCKNGEEYFIDKTPRNYLIIPEIAEIFPDAKFIFLFRSPENVIASMVRTWHNNKFRTLFASDLDFDIGPGLIADGYEMFKDKSILINYEDLAIRPDSIIKIILEYLEIKTETVVLTENGSSGLLGRMGDQSDNNGIVPNNKWNDVFNSPYRKHVFKKIISDIDNLYFTVGGYDKSRIIENINSGYVFDFNPLNMAVDFAEYNFSNFYRRFKLVFFHRNFKWTKNKYFS